MQVFQFRDNVITNYGDYIRSFINVADPRIRGEVEKGLGRGFALAGPPCPAEPAEPDVPIRGISGPIGRTRNTSSGVCARFPPEQEIDRRCW